jgi:addiction module RelE/StbE family toxin
LKRIRWAPAAAEDLENIREYLREHHPALAASTIGALYTKARSLKRFPNRGRIGQIAGTRELVLAPLPFIIVYRTSGELVEVFRIMHTSQDWPRS